MVDDRLRVIGADRAARGGLLLVATRPGLETTMAYVVPTGSLRRLKRGASLRLRPLNASTLRLNGHVLRLPLPVTVTRAPWGAPTTVSLSMRVRRPKRV